MIIGRKVANLKKRDIILIIALLAIASATLLAYRLLTKPSDDSKTEIVVTIHGEEYGRYSIHKDQEIEIPAEYGTSILVIKDGKAKMESAGCPDQICVKHNKIHYNHDMIVCMPNEIIVEVVGGEASNVDVISN
jgi:hypothetical protein